MDGVVVPADHRMVEDRVEIQLADTVTIQAGQTVKIKIKI